MASMTVQLTDEQMNFANKAALGDGGRTLGMLALGQVLQGEGISFMQTLIKLENAAQLLIEENGRHAVLCCQARTPYDNGTMLRVVHPVGRPGHPYDADEWVHIAGRRVDNTTIELIGWCSGRDIPRIDGSYLPTNVHYNILLPMDRLLSLLSDNKLIDTLRMQRESNNNLGPFQR